MEGVTKGTLSEAIKTNIKALLSVPAIALLFNELSGLWHIIPSETYNWLQGAFMGYCAPTAFFMSKFSENISMKADLISSGYNFWWWFCCIIVSAYFIINALQLIFNSIIWIGASKDTGGTEFPTAVSRGYVIFILGLGLGITALWVNIAPEEEYLSWWQGWWHGIHTTSNWVISHFGNGDRLLKAVEFSKGYNGWWWFSVFTSAAATVNLITTFIFPSKKAPQQQG